MERGRRHMSATVADGRLGSTGPTETIGRFLQDNPEVRVQPGRSAVAAPQGGVRRARLWRVFPRRIPTMGYHSVGTTAGDRRLAIWANGGGGLRGRRRQLGGWAAVPVPGPVADVATYGQAIQRSLGRSGTASGRRAGMARWDQWSWLAHPATVQRFRSTAYLLCVGRQRNDDDAMKTVTL